MKNKLCIVLALITVVGCGPDGIRIREDALVVTNGTIIDGTGMPPIADGAVVVQEARILAVGKATAFQIPENAMIVDAGGGTILPGVINSHTHSTHDPAVRRTFLLDGVTTVCNLGTSLDRLPMFEDVSVPEGPAARGYWAGPIITAPGGYPGPVYGSQFSYEVGSPEEARAAVTDLLDRGASVIKIALAPGDPRNPWPVLDLDRVGAIVEEAHARGAMVRAHVFEPYLVEEIVLPAGVDVIEHQPFPILSQEEWDRILASNEPLTLLFDVIAPDYERLLARVVEKGIAMVPTLDGGIGTLFNKTGRSRVEQTVMDVHLEAARRFNALGGTLAVGNDFGGVPHAEPGMPLVEMELLLAAGLTPMEVIVASTLHAARVCGQESTLGSLEAGKLADIIIVDGDPLTDLTTMDRVVAVVKGGELAHQEH
ncbi:amidohydrolase family protein [Gemmatimonadota bacterium]